MAPFTLRLLQQLQSTPSSPQCSRSPQSSLLDKAAAATPCLLSTESTEYYMSTQCKLHITASTSNLLIFAWGSTAFLKINASYCGMTKAPALAATSKAMRQLTTCKAKQQGRVAAFGKRWHSLVVSKRCTSQINEQLTHARDDKLAEGQEAKSRSRIMHNK